MLNFNQWSSNHFLRTWRMGFFVFLFFVKGLGPLSATEQTTSDKLLLKRILDSWRRREISAVTLSASWKIDRSSDDYRSSYQSDYWSPARENTPEGIDLQTLSLKGDQLRYEFLRWQKDAYLDFAGYSAQKPYGKEGGIKYLAFDRLQGNHADGALPQLKSPHQFLSLFQNQIRTDYFQQKGAGKSFAIISRQQRYEKGEHPWLESAVFRPIQLTYRTFRWNSNTIGKETEYRILNRDSNINGRSCILLECSTGQNLLSRCWVDPERNFLILRNILLQNGNSMEQVDIQYKQQQASSDWVPDRWTVIVKSHYADFPGRSLVFQYVTCQMEHLALNPELADDSFRLSFPPGTYLFDSVKKENVIVLPDKTTRQLSSEEIIELDLMGKLPQSKNWFGWATKIMAGTGIVFIAVFILYLRRRWRANHLTTPQLLPELSDEPTPR